MNIVKLFSSCIPVKGYQRSFIYDLQRPTESNAIPNDLYEILTNSQSKTIEEICAEYGHAYDDTIIGYFNFLLDNEFAYDFQKHEVDNFPPINMIWKSPSVVTNSIIFMPNNKLCNARNIFLQLSDLQCDAIQVCLIGNTSTENIRYIGEQLNDLRILSAEILLNNSEKIDTSTIMEIISQYPRIQYVGIGDTCAINETYDKTLHAFSSPIDFNNGCGKISSEYFTVNIECFTESQHHNTCLNRKVCIDAEGNIKNCPAMAKSYGNIKDTTLEEAINKPGFKDLWYICKDQIDVCKDCEFRYMCTDCRCFIKDPDNIYSQPAKCTYNPYICLWEGQEGYVPVEECGTYSRETGFVPDKKRIKELNRKIWGEEE